VSVPPISPLPEITICGKPIVDVRQLVTYVFVPSQNGFQHTVRIDMSSIPLDGKFPENESVALYDVTLVTLLF
jgi:hypothetical protein